MTTPHPDLEEITTETVDHVYELHSTAPSSDLGIHQRSGKLEVTINGTDYTFSQSLTSLNSSGSTTGFVLWRISVPFINWITSTSLYDFKGKYVLEVGAGVTGLFACVLGPKCERYIATDQAHLLKLLKSNIAENITNVGSSTIEGILTQKKKVTGCVDVIEFDWEEPERGEYLLKEVVGDVRHPDYIIGCDIVYNDYLVEPLLDALTHLMGSETRVLIGLQLRLPENIELFLETALNKGFKIYRHPESMLTDELKEGYVIYLIQKS